jgi:hypothetical protein
VPRLPIIVHFGDQVCNDTSQYSLESES